PPRRAVTGDGRHSCSLQAAGPARDRRNVGRGSGVRRSPRRSGARGQDAVAMRLALDTNRYQDLCRGEEHVVSAVESASEVWLPFVVVAELRAGFAVGSRGRANEGVLDKLLAQP